MKDRLILWWEKGGGSAPLVNITDKEVENNLIFWNMMTDTNPHTQKQCELCCPYHKSHTGKWNRKTNY